MKLNITYEVEDGYAGKSRPQQFVFDSEAWCDDWEELTEDEKNDYINQSIDEDFNDKISWCIINKEEV